MEEDNINLKNLGFFFSIYFPYFISWPRLAKAV